MKKLVIRWVALAVCLGLLAFLFVQLGEWQLNRLDERRGKNDAAVANQHEAPVPYRDLMGDPVEESQQWRRVTADGAYTGEQYQVRYRSVDGSPGIEVASVFRTTAGDELLVDRGFIPRQQGQPDTEVLPPPPAGEVVVTGYLRRDERGDDNATAPHDFKVRLINSEAIGASLGRPLLPGYVSLVSSQPPDGGALTPLSPPAPTEGNHFSYALQWFAFSVIALVGIVVLIRTDLKDRRKALARAERRRARAATPGDSSSTETATDAAATD